MGLRESFRGLVQWLALVNGSPEAPFGARLRAPSCAQGLENLAELTPLQLEREVAKELLEIDRRRRGGRFTTADAHSLTAGEATDRAASLGRLRSLFSRFTNPACGDGVERDYCFAQALLPEHLDAQRAEGASRFRFRVGFTGRPKCAPGDEQIQIERREAGEFGATIGVCPERAWYVLAQPGDRGEPAAYLNDENFEGPISGLTVRLWAPPPADAPVDVCHEAPRRPGSIGSGCYEGDPRFRLDLRTIASELSELSPAREELFRERADAVQLIPLLGSWEFDFELETLRPREERRGSIATVRVPCVGFRTPETNNEEN